MVHPWPGVTNSLHRVESVRRNAGRRLVWVKLRKTSNWSIALPGYPRQRTLQDSPRWFGALPIRTTATSENCGQQGVVLNRGRSRILRFQSVVGSGVIAAQRTNSAHLHRPWRANLHLQQELRSHLSEMAASEIPRWTSLENPTVLQAPNSNRE